MRLAQLAQLARAELDGSGDVDIDAVADLAHAHPAAIVLVADARRLPEAAASTAGALLVPAHVPAVAKPALRAANVRAAFARVLGALAPPASLPAGIHATAVVAPTAVLGPGVSVGPLAVIGTEARVGSGSTIMSGAVLGALCSVGDACTIYPNVTIYAGTIIGDRVIIHSGAVIGSDGFGYAMDEGAHLKIPHVGRVVIEDDVEIGANTTVDRATLGETRIGRGTKIDNLVQIGHNVSIGQDVLIVAQAGIPGSVTIGDRVIIAGQAGTTDHVTVGAGARLLGRAGVTKDVPPGATVSGFPARDHREALQLMAASNRLPDLLRRVAELEERLARAEGRTT